ncbi:MAG: carboxylesterase family protein [Proteobacteria bacterium]|nr:carboxylesterase family protein [Pseudomonadota bacterium]
MTSRRRVLIGAALLCLSFTSGLHAELTTGAMQHAPRVEANGESLHGAYAESSPTVAVFRGIPFAAPPVGDLRWREPLPPQPRAGTLQATAFAPACYRGRLPHGLVPARRSGFGAPASAFVDPAVSEVCLYLNVWTPQLDGKAKLPVTGVDLWRQSLRLVVRAELPRLAPRPTRQRGRRDDRLPRGHFRFFGHPGLRGADPRRTSLCSTRSPHCAGCARMSQPSAATRTT